MKLKALQKRIKGGGNAINFINQDEKTITNSDSSLFMTSSSVDEDSDWDKADERLQNDNANSVSEISVLYKLNYSQDTTGANANDLIIPNQEYEYTKILRTFLKDKKNIEKLTENEYENEIKCKTTYKDKLQIMTYPKLFSNEKNSLNTFSITKCQDKLTTENLKDYEVNCYHDSLEFHKKLFQNNWNVLLNVYSFCKYEPGSLSSHNSDSINNPPSLISNSGVSSIGSTRSTNLTHSWSTSISYESAKSNSTSLDEFKMYVDSIGVTANREIILNGSLSDKIKGGIEKTEAVSLNKKLKNKFILITYFKN
jgi:hypothetical protein